MHAIGGAMHAGRGAMHPGRGASAGGLWVDGGIRPYYYQFPTSNFHLPFSICRSKQRCPLSVHFLPQGGFKRFDLLVCFQEWVLLLLFLLPLHPPTSPVFPGSSEWHHNRSVVQQLDRAPWGARSSGPSSPAPPEFPALIGGSFGSALAKLFWMFFHAWLPAGWRKENSGQTLQHCSTSLMYEIAGGPEERAPHGARSSC